MRGTRAHLVVALGGLALGACAAPGEPARSPAPGDAEAYAARCNRLAREVRTWCRTSTGEYRTTSRRECLEARARLDRYCF